MNNNINVEKIVIKNFKSLYDVSLEPGKVNVFIGASGSGKSSVLGRFSSPNIIIAY